MEPEFRLLPKLIASGCLNHNEKEKIEAQGSRSGRRERLLDIILAKRKHHELYAAVCGDVVCGSDQIHVVNLIKENGDGIDIVSKIKAQKEKLSEIMEPDYGLMPKLISSGGLSMKEKEKIEAQTTKSDRSEMLLDVILAKGKHCEFFEALCGSGQLHVVNWIRGNGVYKSEYGSDWPLEDKEIQIIDKNFEKLSSNLETAHGLLDKLLFNDIINYQQMKFLKNEAKTSFKRSEDFLGILRRFSRRSFSLTLECLRELNQAHVAKLLEKPEEGGDYKSSDGSDLLLEDRQIEILDRNHELLINNLDIKHGLLDKMLSKKIINCQMVEFLKTKDKTSFKHNEDFLGILRRFNRRSFSLTVECLRDSFVNQDHIADLLEKGSRS